MKLSERERELELISSFQEKLTGYVELKDFLKHTLPALLNSLLQDAALVVMERLVDGSPSYEVIYSIGYPKEHINVHQRGLFGPAKRVFDEGTPILHTRDVIGHEKGVHGGMLHAADHYVPLLDDKQKVITQGMMMCDSQGTILFSNNRMNRYFNLNERIGENLVDSCHEIAAYAPNFIGVSSSIEALINGSHSHLTQRFSFVHDEQPQYAEL